MRGLAHSCKHYNGGTINIALSSAAARVTELLWSIHVINIALFVKYRSPPPPTFSHYIMDMTWEWMSDRMMMMWHLWQLSLMSLTRLRFTLTEIWRGWRSRQRAQRCDNTSRLRQTVARGSRRLAAAWWIIPLKVFIKDSLMGQKPMIAIERTLHEAKKSSVLP